MRFSALNRKVHYWLALAVALPLLVVIVTGLLLQLKKELAWIQPPAQRGSGKAPLIDFEQILAQARTVSESQINSWADIERLDVRPAHGIVKVRARNDWEIQIDTATGEVLQAAFRRSDIIESMHDGSWFHPRAKLWIFLPVGAILLVLWLSGMYLFFLPIVVRHRRQRPAADPPRHARRNLARLPR